MRNMGQARDDPRRIPVGRWLRPGRLRSGLEPTTRSLPATATSRQCLSTRVHNGAAQSEERERPCPRHEFQFRRIAEASRASLSTMMPQERWCKCSLSPSRCAITSDRRRRACCLRPCRRCSGRRNFPQECWGLWGNYDFVIYYGGGRVPQPGIIVLGRVRGDLSIFEGPEPVTVRLQLPD